MTIQQKAFFEALVKDRESNADILEKPSMRGIQRSVVEKYSDQAHFVYELLQNADDAKATTARFVLYRDRLIFAHNGTRRFTVTDPSNEEMDLENGILGDINAITSIANSNKKEATIGKFGVGFKAVFQYTTTPQIYDPDVFFEIKRFIVPYWIVSDYAERQTGETLFVFPFNHPERNAEEAYSDIANKLKSLCFPILFLSHLKDIIVKTPEGEGIYAKEINQNFKFDDTTAQFVSLESLTHDDNDNIEEKLWLFSRTEPENHTYSVGFFVDKENHLISKKHTAFCFFPTKEVTNLNFIIHAPFLLTDSREGIRAGVMHNSYMIELLAELAADSFEYLKQIGIMNDARLIDDDILNLLPYNPSVFNDINDISQISFKPFYTEIKNKFETAELLPYLNGYTSKINAYWTEYSQWATDCLTTKIISDKQLALLSGQVDAKWVFVTLSRAEILRNDRPLANYIDEITANWYGQDKIIDTINSTFIENQSIDWLHSFYKYINASKERTKRAKNKPILLNQDKKAVVAFDSNEHLVLFLPTDISGYNTVFSELLENEETTEFITITLGIEKPTLRDEIYNHILPLSNDTVTVDSIPHFTKFFAYYSSLSQSEQKRFVEEIKSCPILLYNTIDSDKMGCGSANSLYFPNENLRKYFKPTPNTRFLCEDEYLALIPEDKHEELHDFFIALGVLNLPRFLERDLTKEEADTRKSSNGKPVIWQKSSFAHINRDTWRERYLDGCENAIEKIISESSQELSEILFDILIKIFENKCNNCSVLEKMLSGFHQYFYRYEYREQFDSRDIFRLRNEKWLLNNNGEFVAANSISFQTLSKNYDIDNDKIFQLIEFLKIKDIPSVEDDYFTEEQRRAIEWDRKLREAGISDDDLEQLISNKRLKLQSEMTILDTKDEVAEVTNAIQEIAKRAVEKKQKSMSRLDAGDTTVSQQIVDINYEKDVDEDEYVKPAADFNKKIEQAKEREATEVNRIIELEELTGKASACERYSFEWFKVLLELEIINAGDDKLRNREISINFGKVAREPDTERTLLLKQPSRYIPQFMEDLADIPLELRFVDKSPVKLAIEVVSVKSYDLRVKLKSGSEINGIDLSTVVEARIEAKNPVFLLGELQKTFNNLGFADDFNMQKNLCENIEFIFGPPGTGKTTYLSNNVVLPLMKQTERLKVLVLTPTNKAADVLTERIISNSGEDFSYSEWLVLFGTTNSSFIEKSGVYRDKTFDLRKFPRNVTITTIARFAYDYFMPAGERLHLIALNWDYIIIDEASMIPLINIMLPLYKKTPRKFVIAGDPFQIEPITAVEQWKGENIYTLVGLNSFTEPKTKPYNYPVTLLTTQYRSIPTIGEVFSRFTYGGVLKHARNAISQRRLGIEQDFDLKDLNIIKFPVSNYESIYRPKKLNNSNYQIYSALFTFEFTKYISELINQNNPEGFFRIGIIAPYRAQSDLINKLMYSLNLPNNIDVQVGTIHSFQGDECDIIISVFNTPPSISDSNEMFLNKRNIINVSISRAKDYLFILMPDNKTTKVENLKFIKIVEQLFHQVGNCVEKQSQQIEEEIFSCKTYIEDNAFSTSHQSVNVYDKPERRYEVRTDDNAVDVQIFEDNAIG
jgi:hypothetical protein